MTPAYIVPQRETRTYKFSLFRVIVMSVLLFLLVTACLYLYHTAFREYGVYLTEQDKKSTAWITEQISYMLPFIAIAVFQYAVYAKHDNRDGVLQKERAYEILITALLVYLVLLPYVWQKSDALLKVSLIAKLDVDKTEGKEYQTLLLSVMEWFIRLAIPLGLLYVYHHARAKAEKKEALLAAAETQSTHSEEASNAEVLPSTVESEDTHIPQPTKEES